MPALEEEINRPAVSLRETLAARPLIVITLAYALGIGMGSSPTMLAGWGIAVFFCLFMAVRRDGIWRMALLCAVFAGTGALWQKMRAIPDSRDISRYIGSGRVTLQCEVDSDTVTHLSYLTCKATALRIILPDRLSKQVTGRISLRLREKENSPGPRYGDLLEVCARLEAPDEARNPGGFSLADWMRGRSIYTAITAKRSIYWRHIPRPVPLHVRPARIAQELRNSLLRSLHRVLPPSEAALLAGIMLGSQSDFPPGLTDDFALTGTAHILAASGMNVGFIALMILWLSKLLRVPPTIYTLSSLICLAFYSLICGGGASIVRADLMIGSFLVAGLLYREPDIGCAVAFSALVQLVQDPQTLYDIGFQLSYAAVIGITLTAPLIDKAGRWGRGASSGHTDLTTRAFARIRYGLCAGITLTIAASIATAPLTAYHFHQFSLIAVPANLLITPWLALLTYSGFALWAIAGWLPGLAALFAHGLIGPAMAGLIGIAHVLARNQSAALSSPTPENWMIAVYFAMMGMGLYFYIYGNETLRRRAWIPPSIVFCSGFAWILLFYPKSAGMMVTILDVGQGDCALLQTRDGVAVVDAGPVTDTDDAGRRIVLPYLRGLGVQRIDTLVLTHADDDHIGGAATLLERLPVARVLMGGIPADSPAYYRLMLALHDRGVPIYYPRQGMTVRLTPNLDAKVINPDARTAMLDNDGSLSLHVRYGKTSLLLPGDSGSVAESEMINSGVDLKSDILKLGHHGSRLSSGETFLDAVQPVLAISSESRNNVFGHPSPYTISRLQKRGIPLLRTDQLGGIVLRTDGEKWYLH